MKVNVYKIKNRKDYGRLFNSSFIEIYQTLNCLVKRKDKDFYLISLEENHKIPEMVRTTTIIVRPKIVFLTWIGEFEVDFEREIKTNFMKDVNIYFTRDITSSLKRLKMMSALEELIEGL